MWKQIHYLLYLHGSFVNYNILYNYKALKYISINDVISVLATLSKSTIIIIYQMFSAIY